MIIIIIRNDVRKHNPSHNNSLDVNCLIKFHQTFYVYEAISIGLVFPPTAQNTKHPMFNHVIYNYYDQSFI